MIERVCHARILQAANPRGAVWCDETFAAMHGYEQEEIIGVNLAVLVPIKPEMVERAEVYTTSTTKVSCP